jgi:hypothetical protein
VGPLGLRDDRIEGWESLRKAWTLWRRDVFRTQRNYLYLCNSSVECMRVPAGACSVECFGVSASCRGSQLNSVLYLSTWCGPFYGVE